MHNALHRVLFSLVNQILTVGVNPELDCIEDRISATLYFDSKSLLNPP